MKKDAKKGTSLIWTNFELGSCATEEFDDIYNHIEFKVQTLDGDDFCPKILTIRMDNSDEYKSDEMNEWVDNSKGNNIKRTLGINS